MRFWWCLTIVVVATELCWNCVLVESHSNINDNILRFELRPTGSLVYERRRLRSNNVTDTDLSSFGIPSAWLHPWTRAVYATLHPPPQGMDDASDASASATAAYQDFVRYRHLSRFERHLRTELNWDLQPHWHGNYSNTTFYHQHGQNRRQRNLLESMAGGRFDNYQAVPLSQGYGTHYVHLWVGSPSPQRQSVIVDTGSHWTAFPVKGKQNRECKMRNSPPAALIHFQYRRRLYWLW